MLIAVPYLTYHVLIDPEGSAWFQSTYPVADSLPKNAAKILLFS